MKLVPFLIVITALVSCSPVKNYQWDVPSSQLVWPGGDEKARVRHLLTVTPGVDFPVHTDRRMWDWFAGETEVRRLVAPYGVAIIESGAAWVSSPTRGFVCKIDLEFNKLEYFTHIDGKGLSIPSGIFFDSSTEDLLIADVGLQGVFRFNSNLKFMYSLDSPGGFGRPAGISIDSNGLVYVVDVLLNRISKFSSTGEFIEFIGEDVGLNGPTNITIGSAGQIYVVDSLNFRVVVFNSSGEYLGEIGSLGDSPGYFARPRGVAVDSNDNVYVSDAAFDNIQVFDKEGRLLLYFGALGNEDGMFSQPAGMSIDDDDRLYVADNLNNRIEVFQLYPDGE